MPGVLKDKKSVIRRSKIAFLPPLAHAHSMERVWAFAVCLIGVLLPWRLRVVFSEIIGWFTQFIYFSYFGILNFILKELKKAELERAQKEKAG